MKKSYGSKNSSMFGQDRMGVKRELLEKGDALLETYSGQYHTKKVETGSEGSSFSVAFCIQNI